MQKTYFKSCQKIMTLEFIGFGIMALALWIDEIFDLPYHLLGAPPTPINIRESIFETFLIVLLAILTISYTKRILARIQILEGLLSMCCSCKKIRSNNTWIHLEEYLLDHSYTQISHGICPECKEAFKAKCFSEK